MGRVKLTWNCIVLENNSDEETSCIYAIFCVCMHHVHAKLLYAAPALMLIIITIEITNYCQASALPTVPVLTPPKL